MNKQYIVCWVHTTPANKQKDHYQPFIDYNDNYSAAKKFYNSLLERDNVYSANLCEIVESTDY